MENTGKCLHENSCPAVKETDQGDYLVIGRIVREGTFASVLATELGLGVGVDEVAVIVPAHVMLRGMDVHAEESVLILGAEYERLMDRDRRLRKLEDAGVVTVGDIALVVPCGAPYLRGGGPCTRPGDHVPEGTMHRNAEDRRW